MEALWKNYFIYQDYGKIIKYYIKEHIYIYINFNILKYYTVLLKIE